jgi:uncharacterized OB-fold protein
MGGPVYAQCDDCGASSFPPRGSCPACGSPDLWHVTSDGAGVVYSTTTVHRREGAHDVSLIDLDEGIRVMSEVVGIAPDDVRIGMAVRARLEADGRVVFDVL